MKEAILFDLDGTLIDSAPDLAASLNHTLATLGLPTYDLATVRSWIGGGATKLLQRALGGSKEPKEVDEKLLAKAKEIFFAHYGDNLCNQTTLYPCAKELLESLKGCYRLALVTNKPTPFVRPILQTLDIDIFDVVLGGESLEYKKPHPAPLLHACELLGVRCDEALMVGDSINDYQAAKSAGIDVVIVPHGYDDVKTFAKEKEISDLCTLKERLCA